jgi:hypothetical protein
MGGQIVLVPEPSTLTVLVLSAAASIAVIGILKRSVIHAADKARMDRSRRLSV